MAGVILDQQHTLLPVRVAGLARGQEHVGRGIYVAIDAPDFSVGHQMINILRMGRPPAVAELDILESYVVTSARRARMFVSLFGLRA